MTLRKFRKNTPKRAARYGEIPGPIESDAPMMRMGSPRIKRSNKLLNLWEEVKTDPPCLYNDPNVWREPADVRPSSFPFCPRKYVLNRLGIGIKEDFNVKSNYYTSIGQAVHSVVQNAFARTKLLWGLWQCCRPSCRRMVSSQPSFLPDRCFRCGSEKLEYVELRLYDSDIGLEGNTDGVLVYGKHSSILEIKTAGVEKVKSLLKRSDGDIAAMFANSVPWFGYWHQATAYAVLAARMFSQIPPITSVTYVIAARDSPDVMASFELSLDVKLYEIIKSRVKMAQYAAGKSVVPVGFATNGKHLSLLPACQYCTHKKVCLQPELHVKFDADALHDKVWADRLNKVMEKHMGTVINGDVANTSNIVEVQDVVTTTTKKKKEDTEEDEEEKAEEGEG